MSAEIIRILILTEWGLYSLHTKELYQRGYIFPFGVTMMIYQEDAVYMDFK
jgi:hypothetical protein